MLSIYLRSLPAPFLFGAPLLVVSFRSSSVYMNGSCVMAETAQPFRSCYTPRHCNDGRHMRDSADAGERTRNSS